MLNSCGNLYFNTLTVASLVCLCRGSIQLVSWQVLRASLGAISLKLRPVEHVSWILNTPDFEYVPVVIILVCWCHLDRNKYSHSRLFSAKILSLLKASMTVPQWEFPVLWLVKILSRREPLLLSYVTHFNINIRQFCRWSVWDSAPAETPQSSLEATRHSPLEGLPLEVRGTTGCTRVLGEGIGATEHKWGWWCFGATEHLYPYRMKCGLGGSVAQNTTAISLVV